MVNNKNKISTTNPSSFKFGEEIGFLANEAYKRLRTNIIYSFADDNKTKTIGFTSSFIGEGKTTSVVNLAYSLSLIGKQVLLIECDLRRPQIADMLKLDKNEGLVELLIGKTKYLQSITQRYPNNADESKPSFDVIVSGRIPPNPSELLDSVRMKRVLEAVKDAYDYVLIDLPPVSLVADPIIISKHLDGMVFVVRHEYTDKGLLKKSLNQVEATGVKMLGVIYNGDNSLARKTYTKKGYSK